MIKQEKFSDKYMEIREKVSSITKKTNIELVYCKKYLIIKKHSRQKKEFNAFI